MDGPQKVAADTFAPVNSVAVLLAANRGALSSDTTLAVLADAGVENVNAQIDELIIGDRLRARHPRVQETEAAIACNILNRMFELGRPTSFAIGP